MSWQNTIAQIFLLTPLYADVSMLNQGLYGPERVTSGSYMAGYNPQVILTHFFGWRTTYKITAIDAATNVVTMPGNDFAEGTIGYLHALPGGQLPSVAAEIRQYRLVNKDGDKFQVQTMDSTVIVDFASPDEWHDVVFAVLRNVYDPQVSPHVYAKPGPMAPGITLAGVDNSCRGPANLTADGYQNYNGAGANFCYILDIAPNARPGVHTLSFLTHCPTNPACKTLATFQLEVVQTPPMGVVKPTSFPAIPGLRVWEEAMVGPSNNSAAYWCNLNNGTTRFPLGYGDMTGIWYYDGGKTYAQIARYLKDFRYNRCAQTIDNFFADTWIANGNPGAGYKATTFGVLGMAQSGVMKGNEALKIAFDPERTRMDALSNGYCPTADCMRETAYGIQACITYAQGEGYQRWADIPLDASTNEIRTRCPRLVSQGLGQLVQTRGKSNFDIQTFMIGLLLRELITWQSYTGDNRIIRAVKEELDWLKANMYNRDPQRPNEISWHRDGPVANSTQGPKCDNHCFPEAMQDLAGLLLPAWAWLWSVTADQQYLRDGDGMFLNYVQKYLSYFYGGKQYNQGYVWMFNYVFWRTNVAPMYP